MDAFALAKAGKMSTAVALDLCKAYKNENCYPVWSALASGLSEVTDICFCQQPQCLRFCEPWHNVDEIRRSYEL